MQRLKLVDQDRRRQTILSEADNLEDLIYRSFQRNNENSFVRMKKTYKTSDGFLIQYSYNTPPE
jgi:hypothetical protein